MRIRDEAMSQNLNSLQGLTDQSWAPYYRPSLGIHTWRIHEADISAEPE